jgi:hypothetical protein
MNRDMAIGGRGMGGGGAKGRGRGRGREDTHGTCTPGTLGTLGWGEDVGVGGSLNRMNI